MNPMKMMGDADKLSIQQLQQSIQNGTVPAYIGVPLLQEKVKQQKAMQASMAAPQGPAKPPVAQQVMQEAQGVSALPSNLAPEGYADGGIVAFAGGGLNIQEAYDILQEPTASPEDRLRAKHLIDIQPQTPAMPIMPTRSKYGVTQTPVGTKDQIKGYLSDAGNKYGVPEDIMHGIAKVESGFNPNAKNPNSTASGLGQFTAGTWKDWGTNNPDDRFNPQLSADAMARYLKSNRDKFGGDWGKAVSAYHIGPNSSNEALAADAEYRNKVLGSGEYDDYYPSEKGISAFDKGVRAIPQQSAIPSFDKISAPTIPFDEAAYDASLHTADETDARKQAEGIRGLLPENKGMSDLRNKISDMEAKSKTAEEKAPWMALMKAGLATMAGTSPFALANIGAGGQAGLEDYIKSKNDLDKAAEKRYDMQSRLETAQRSEDVAIATKGYDSAAANRAADIVTRREKARDKANNAHWNAQEQLEADKANLNAQAEAQRIGVSKQTAEATNKHYAKPDLYTYINQIQELRAQGKTKEADDLQELVSTMVHPYYGAEKASLKVDDAYKLYLQDKMPDVPAGLSKEEFAKYYSTGQTTPAGGIQNVNGRKTYVPAS